MSGAYELEGCYLILRNWAQLSHCSISEQSVINETSKRPANIVVE